jgi:hypothetical protein
LENKKMLVTQELTKMKRGVGFGGISVRLWGVYNSRLMMEGIAVNNTTIFVMYNNVSTTRFGHFLTGHHQVEYNVRGTIHYVLTLTLMIIL